MKQKFEIELELNNGNSKFTWSEVNECIKDSLLETFDFEDGEEIKIKEVE